MTYKIGDVLIGNEKNPYSQIKQDILVKVVAVHSVGITVESLFNLKTEKETKRVLSDVLPEYFTLVKPINIYKQKKEVVNMKFKVGDYVRIKEGAKVGRIPEGKCYKILEIEPGGWYKIEADRPNSVWSEGVLELATPKDILEPGMIFECRNGYRYMFISENYAINEAFYINDVFNENAIGKWDIVKIYEKKESYSLRHSLENTENVIWEEKAPVKEMTIKEISEKLGYEVKVIKE